jgi:hypothetical protein
MSIPERRAAGGIDFGSSSSLSPSELFLAELSSPSALLLFLIVVVLLRFILVLDFDVLF